MKIINKKYASLDACDSEMKALLKKYKDFKTTPKDVTVTIRITKDQKKFLDKNEINMSLLFTRAIEELKTRPETQTDMKGGLY